MISPELHYDLARARADDLRRTADARRLARLAAQPEAPLRAKGVTLRFGCADDEKALARLAELDSSGPLAQPVLLAEIDGQLLAALALTDGSVVADPFHRTADLIDLLRARARQLDGNRRPRRPFRLRTWSRLRGPAWR